MTDHRRLDDSDGTAVRPLARVITLKQLAGILAFVAVLQTIGGKFVIDSYIDSRVKVHDENTYAHMNNKAIEVHSVIFAEMKADREAYSRRMEEVTRLANDTNQRLARIEGALSGKLLR